MAVRGTVRGLRGRGALLVAALVTFGGGCAGSGGEEGCAVEVRVRSGGSPVASPFLLVAEHADWAAPRRITCPAAGDAVAGQGLACGEGGVRLSAAPSSFDLFVLAPGFRSVRTVATPGACPATVDVDLPALPAAEATDDYRTGFPAGQDGLDAMLAFAWKASDELGPVHAMKFYLEDPDGEATVWFQNTRRHPIHYDFAREVLRRPWSLADFEARTYHGAARPAMAGTVLWRPDLAVADPAGGTVRGVMTVEFPPYDDLLPGQAATAWRLIQERLPFVPLAGGERRLFYLPSGSVTEEQAIGEARALAAGGVSWLRRMDVYGSVEVQFLNAGVAYGTLKVMAPEDLVEGAVSFRDVVVLTRLPNDLPIVGGTISDELQTPLAHVNLSARARGTPNLALVGASGRDDVKALVGKLVRFEVKAGSWTLAETTLAEAEAFWEKAAGRPPLVPTFDLSRTDLPAFPDLGFDDTDAYGAKASNLAEMSHVIPERTPLGLGVPFHWYDAFLDRAVVDAAGCDGARDACRLDGRAAEACDAARTLCTPPAGTETLRAHLDRLLDDAGFKTDTALRAAALAGVRDHFCRLPQDPAFAELLDRRVQEVHGTTKIKLRSSTNAEDLPNFTGAGLYTSVSATWGTAKSPSARICQVWASAWNWAAFEERSFWNVDHRAVRMGVCASTAWPDEQANGVLITKNLLDPFTPGYYVNVQKGEVSVTNPTDGSIPEVFAILPGAGGSVQVARQRFSNLSPDAPLMTDAEIAALFDAAGQVARHLAPLYGKNPDLFPFDFEFKVHGPERRLILKQVRPYQQSQVK